MTSRTALPANPFPAPERALPPLARVGEYQIEQVLAQSSFAVVYRAHDTVLNLQVAIKEYLPDALALRGAEVQVLPRTKAQAERFELGRKAFIDEAQVLARCDHPSLVHVKRILHQHGTVYRVMRHCPGPTLLAQRRDCAEAPTAATVRAWLDALLGALQVLHDAGCVHGAVAPGNIVLGASGRPLLLDFEAVRSALISDRTQSMMVALEPCFAPIEQREPSTMMPLGPWTDLYSLAATLHFCISGHLPAPPAHDGVRAGFDALGPLWQRRGVALDNDTARLAAAIDACLVEWPQHRPQNVAAFKALLDSGVARAPAAAVAAASPRATVAAAAVGTGAPVSPAVVAPAAVPDTAAIGDDRHGERLIADLDQAFARIAAGAHDDTPPPLLPSVRLFDSGRDAPDTSANGPVPPRSAPDAVPSRIDPVLTQAPSAQPSQAAAQGAWPHSAAAAADDAAGDALPAHADDASTPVPAPFAAPKTRSLQVAGALAALVFVGVVFVLADWGPAADSARAPPAEPAAVAAPRATDQAPVAKTPIPALPVEAAAPPNLASPAPQDALGDVPATTAGAAAPPPSAVSGATTAPSPERIAEPPVTAAPPRPPRVAAAPKAKTPPGPASPREVCGNRTQFSLYQCMQTQCASAKWSAHAQCVRLRHSDSVD